MDSAWRPILVPLLLLLCLSAALPVRGMVVAPPRALLTPWRIRTVEPGRSVEAGKSLLTGPMGDGGGTHGRQGIGIGSLFLFWLVVGLMATLIRTRGIVGSGRLGQLNMAMSVVMGGAFALFIVDNLLVEVELGTLGLRKFGQFFLAGGLCALVTHALCTPIDVVKTRFQLKAYEGKYDSFLDAFFKIMQEEGFRGLWKGLGATASGYFLHGAFKYSFYEVFKVILTDSPEAALKPPLIIAACAGFLTECVACLLLCPMEAIRIRSVADSEFPQGVFSGLVMISKMEGFHGLYKGLPSILLKQVPFTLTQFVSFESAVVLVKFVAAAALRVEPGANEISPSNAAGISTLAGFLAGIAAAIISHPGDTILSKVNQEESESTSSLSPSFTIFRVARQLGFRGLFLGLGARLIQVSCMVGGQFLIYDSIKLFCGITPASALPSAVIKTGLPAAAVKD